MLKVNSVKDSHSPKKHAGRGEKKHVHDLRCWVKIQ
jgi:hypothetical protein